MDEGRKCHSDLRSEAALRCFFIGVKNSFYERIVICGRHPDRGQGVHNVWSSSSGKKASVWDTGPASTYLNHGDTIALDM